MKIAVIGAGIFGITTALQLSENNYDVTLFESEDDIMQKASKCNHNRLHFGFHYPRSLETATQSIDGFNLFCSMFAECIVQDFPNYYLVHKNGKIGREEYLSFCEKLKVKYEIRNPSNLVEMSNIDISILTNEPVFDFEKLKAKLSRLVNYSDIKLRLNKQVTRIEDLEGFDFIVNTAYSNINCINNIFDIPKLKLRLQDVIVPIFELDMHRIGLTVVDGEFCSIMPKGFEESKFLLYHVKHSVLNQIDGTDLSELMINNDPEFLEKAIEKIYLNSLEYYPFLENVSRVSHWRTVRALPINNNDERLSYLNFYNEGNKRIISVLTGKITTCWLIAEKITQFVNENVINR